MTHFSCAEGDEKHTSMPGDEHGARIVRNNAFFEVGRVETIIHWIRFSGLHVVRVVHMGNISRERAVDVELELSGSYIGNCRRANEKIISRRLRSKYQVPYVSTPYLG